jgi:hypothetical protein
MIPGFASIYIDKEQYKHLYFYPGIDDNDNPIYGNIELPNCQFKYDRINNIDNSIDYKFYNRSIIKIICNLVKLNGDTDIKVLSFK